VSTTTPSAIDTTPLDEAIAELAAGAARWTALPAIRRAALFEETHAAIASVAREWAEIASRVKGLDPSSGYATEAWMSGPYAALAAADAYAQTLRRIGTFGTPLYGATIKSAPGDRLAVRVLPTSLKQWVLFNGFGAEVWMPPGVDEETVRWNAGLSAVRPGECGGVGLVLGAGNVSSIAPLDAFYELVADNRASIVKLNPTFDALLPVYERALAPLIEFGVVRIVTGEGDVGAYLAQHEGVDKVHITGSAVTHDLIVWGRGEEADRRRAEQDPILTKPITSELGGVSPVIVVPGDWSDADLRFQAEHVATMRLHNSGHNCIAAQAIVLSADWPQKDAFLSHLRAVLDELPPRTPWYPGTEAKVERALEHHPDAETHRGRILIEVDATSDDELLSYEYFAPVLGYVELPGRGAAFLESAVEFANERLDGTLGANVIIAPADRVAMGARFDAAIERLRYGTIAINAWTAVGFMFPHATWGGFPGHTIEAVGSGIGVVHNAYLLDGPERTIVTGPFRPFPRSIARGELSLFPKPPWFLTARHGLETGRRLADFAAKPSWGRLGAVLVAAFKP